MLLVRATKNMLGVKTWGFGPLGSLALKSWALALMSSALALRSLAIALKSWALALKSLAD